MYMVIIRISRSGVCSKGEKNMEHIKLQVGCLLLILYVVFVYVRERRRFGHKEKLTLFDVFLGIAILTITFDGLTAYTVNHLETVSETCNRVFHMFFLLGLDSCIFCVISLYAVHNCRFSEKERNAVFINRTVCTECYHGGGEYADVRVPDRECQ